MKSKSELAAFFYTVLSALVESKKAPHGQLVHGVPNGHLYAQLLDCCELGEWMMIVDSMKTNQWITETKHLLQITPKGEALHARLDKIYKEARSSAQK